jgi:hypothetical protein
MKRKYLVVVLPFLVIQGAMTAWMLSDPIDVSQVGDTFTYRPKHNFALLVLPLAGMFITSAAFMFKQGKLGWLFSLPFLAIGAWATWSFLSLDISNSHVKVGPDGVYSEWGTSSDPQSQSIDFTTTDAILVTTRLDGDRHRPYIIAANKSNGSTSMPINDIVRHAMTRILKNAEKHELPVTFANSTSLKYGG